MQTRSNCIWQYSTKVILISNPWIVFSLYRQYSNTICNSGMAKGVAIKSNYAHSEYVILWFWLPSSQWKMSTNLKSCYFTVTSNQLTCFQELLVHLWTNNSWKGNECNKINLIVLTLDYCLCSTNLLLFTNPTIPDRCKYRKDNFKLVIPFSTRQIPKSFAMSHSVPGLSPFVYYSVIKSVMTFV